MAARSILALLVVAALTASVRAPAAQTESHTGDRRVPVLMYHVLSGAPDDAPYPELYVRPETFRAQLRWLDRHGYTAVTLRAVWSHWHRGGELPPRPVVISIDDGFRDTATVALPALRARGWPGVLNLALHHLDVGWGLSDLQVRALIRAGWEIDSHTLTHPDLTAVSDAQLEREVAGSKHVLERRFRVPVEFFCYPAGRHDARTVAAVRRAGYLGATTTVEGLARREEPFTLRRMRINGSDGVADLARKLAQLR
jgi:peptidoglycan/xylan/chitin deacetylase (PgdA/CDA1 family)